MALSKTLEEIKKADINKFPGKGRPVGSWTLSSAFDSFFDYLRNVQRKPVSTQIAIGAGTGVVTGYLFSKISRLVALCAGCSIIFIQFLNYRGYLKFNRSQFRNDLNNFQNTLGKDFGLSDKSSLPTGLEIDDFANKYAYLLGGYMAGTLIGYGLS